MIKRITALALAVLLPVLLGAKGCPEEHETHPSAPRVPQVPRPAPTSAVGRAPVPDPHAGDPEPSGREERTFSVHVGGLESEVLPAEVIVYSMHATPGAVDDYITRPGVTAVYTFTFDANGPNITISVELKPARAGSKKGFCWIEAGKFGHDGPKYIAGGLRVNCYLLIKTGH